jgi:hypothetical protein
MKRCWITIFCAAFLAFGTSGVARPQGTPRGEQSASKPSANQPQPSQRLIATGKMRIAPGKQTVVILQGSENVPLDYFAEFVIVRMTDEKSNPESLMGKEVLLVRSTTDTEQWSVFLDGAVGVSGDALSLSENVFRVQKALSPTDKEQVRVQIGGLRVANGRFALKPDGGWRYTLKSGEILLVLG